MARSVDLEGVVFLRPAASSVTSAAFRGASFGRVSETAPKHNTLIRMTLAMKVAPNAQRVSSSGYPGPVLSNANFSAPRATIRR